METLKFFLGFIAFVILYLAIDILVPLIPQWVGMAVLISIVAGLVRLIFLIAKGDNK
jgi:hypothetical protein